MKHAFTGWNFVIYFGAGWCFVGLHALCDTPLWLRLVVNIAAGVVLGWNIKAVRYWLRIDKPTNEDELGPKT